MIKCSQLWLTLSIQSNDQRMTIKQNNSVVKQNIS